MALLLSLSLTTLYLVGAGVTFSRLQGPPTAIEEHKRRCGMYCPSLYHCPRHDRANTECDACWKENQRHCLDKCKLPHAGLIALQVAAAVCWLPMLPVLLGYHIARPKPKTDLLDAERIDALEREILEMKIR